MSATTKIRNKCDSLSEVEFPITIESFADVLPGNQINGDIDNWISDTTDYLNKVGIKSESPTEVDELTIDKTFMNDDMRLGEHEHETTHNDPTQNPMGIEDHSDIIVTERNLSQKGDEFKPNCDTKPYLDSQTHDRHQYDLDFKLPSKNMKDGEQDNSAHKQRTNENTNPDFDDLPYHLQYKEDMKSLGDEPIDFDKKLFDSKVESIDCDMCFVEGRVVSPTSYCYTCQIYLCGTCYRYHAKIPTTLDHSVVHKNDLIKNVYKPPATYHGDKTKGNVYTEKRTPDTPVKINRDLVEPGRYASKYVRDEDTLCAPCKIEGRKEPGSAFCIACSQYLCVKCKTYHTKLGVTRDHEMVHKHAMEEKDFKTFVPAIANPTSPGVHSMLGSSSTISSKTESSVHGPTVKLKNPKTFSSLAYHDMQTPQITGLAFIGGGKILVCDRRNKSIKLFSDKLTPLSSLNMAGIADVTALNDSTAVVSQPEDSVILYIGFKDDSKMFVRRTVETKGRYWGVDSLHGELFALCMADMGSQATIHMLSTTGQILSVIHPHLGQGYDLQLKNSSYFAVSPAGGTFYISDSILGVVAIGTDGRAIFNCQSPDIERPCGIQADSKNVYVCCPATSSMVTISPDGRYFYEVLSLSEDMLLPNCIALLPNSNQMAVAFLEGETINLYKDFRKM